MLTSINATAQKIDTSYKKEWILIDSLVNKDNATKTALNKVNAVYKKAKQQDKQSQLIKALIYKMELGEKIKEDNTQANIELLKKEIETSQNAAAKSILWCLLAKQYNTYYSNNQWQINERSETTEKQKNDITVWSKDDFTKQIFTCYAKSIEAKNELQKTYLADFDVLIIYGTEVTLRPTLYDILAHEVLDYYKNNSGNYYDEESTKKIANTKALATEQEFLNVKFESKEFDDANNKALQLFQQLISFHKKDKSPNATIDVDLERIEWVYSKANFSNKDELYLKALETITTNHSNLAATQAWFLQAKFYSNKADTYKAFTKTTNRFDNAKTLEIINTRLKINSDSCEGNKNMKALRTFILRKAIATKTEAINVPDQPFRMLVNFRNTPTLFYRIIKLKNKIDNADDEDDYSYNDKFWSKVVNRNYAKQVEQKLPSINDYQEHSTEIKIDALPAGSYAILSSTSKNFDTEKDKLCYLQFTVSGLSYIENNGDLFVVDRDNGNPLEAVTVKVSRSSWNSEKQKSVWYEVGKLITDKNGFASVKKLKNNDKYNLTYTFIKKGDTLISTNNNYYESVNSADTRTNTETEKDNAVIHFYTDRSIYRPGQTVFFKGIATTKSKNAIDAKLFLSMPKNKVYLRDVNGKNIDTIDIQLNEYGSFNGKFILPLNALTGSFSLMTENSNGYINFNVEEYKRPKFFVDFDKQKNTYKLNDSIKITGNAKAYAGNNIDGAKVAYTVTRKARFENYWMYWRMPQPNSAAKQMANGEMKTDAQGKFNITFKAMPDEDVDRNTNPIFDYEITASVTDINGETRESSTAISVGYNSIILKIDVPEKVDATDFINIKLSATNLAGESIAAKLDIKIVALQTPTRLIRNRFWNRPDTFVLTQDEYIKSFPYDEYDNETDKLSWKEKETILKDTVSTYNDLRTTIYDFKNKFTITNSQLLITITTKDNEGNKIESKAFVEVTNKNSLPYPQYHSATKGKTSVKAGDTANIGFATNAQNIFVLKDLVINNNKPNEEFLKNNYSFEQISNNFNWSKQLENDATKGFGMYYAFVKNNRFYSGGSSIELIKPSKKLNITYGTFRNKTLPGSKETYSIKVSGETGEKLAAEVLTAMYDASLDQFRMHNWTIPNFDDYEDYWANFSFKISDKSSFAKYSNDGMDELDTYDKYNKLGMSTNNLEFYFNKYYLGKYRTYAWSFGTYAIKDLSGSSIGVRSNWAANDATFKYSASPAKIEVAQFTPPKIIGEEHKLLNPTVDESNKNEAVQKTPNNDHQTQIRKNFNEKAFFFPNVYADSNGNYTFSFTMPEALTKWKWLSLAHTKNLEFGLSENTVVTTKPIMVQPNAPRFLREGDVMEFTAKIANTTDKEITGSATLELIDAITGNSVDGLFNNVFPLQYFTVAANQSSVVKFPIQVPMNFAKPLTYRVVANTSPIGGGWVGADGEENTLPVLTNKIFLTESLPIYVKSNEQSKTIDLKPLFNTASNRSGETITVEYTSNPVWNVVQALPYLMEYPYECAEQTFNRFFANAMASSIINNNKNIKRAVEKWKAESPSLLGKGWDGALSKLQNNEELKALILTETPWVLDAESEVEQQKRLALLLDLDKMQSNINTTIEKLKNKQLSNGAFSWFDGGRENDYITQYIATGIGKLKLINALNKAQQKQLDAIATKALLYLDSRMERDYKNYIASLKNTKNKSIFWGNSLDVNYWYMRSMFTNNKLSATLLNAQKLFTDNATKNWTKESVYMQGMIAIALNRLDNKNLLSKKILNSIKENAVEDTAKGTMYWKQNEYCYYWYQNNFETQALLIEAFNEIAKDNASIDKMKTWLILNKQTNRWNSTIATSAACYAILNYGSNWVNNQQTTEVRIADKVIKSNDANAGYLKAKLDDITVNKIVESSQPQIIIKQSNNQTINNSPSYGAVYFQYFADVNDVKSSTKNAPLTLVKKLFIEKNNGTKKVLEPVNDNEELNIGDKLIIRIELRCDREMEFLHLKDMRAANTEPTNVLSGYKWQEGLGYYESTRDASTNFFIDNMQRGTYVFEYPLFITHSGNYSVGLASIQCMYAPEFTSHSNGIKIRVK